MSAVNIPHPNLKAQFSFFKLLIISGIVNIMHAHIEAFRRITDYLGNICNRLNWQGCLQSFAALLPAPVSRRFSSTPVSTILPPWFLAAAQLRIPAQ
jgi:hypothetical protein